MRIVLLVFVCCLCSTPLSAEIFKYIDDQGRAHYVTDPAKVPERYREQVTARAELPGIGRYQESGPKLKPGESAPAPLRPHAAVSKKVEIFVTTWCPYCQRLEKFLKDNRIQYTRYDIEHDSKGMLLHQQLGGGGVPVTRIGSTVIRGFSPDDINRALGRR